MPESFAFRITGVEPHDAAWRAAGTELRREFWRAVVAIGLVVKDEELAQGLDRRGNPLVPITEYTRRYRKSAMGFADPNAPALTPAYGLSRTRSLLHGRAGKDYAEFFWKFDAVMGKHWGRVLGYHRSGAGRLPKRDVIGISPASLTSVRHKAQIWWDYRKRGIILEQAVRDFQLPATTPAMPAKIPLVGRTDFENFTFGIGGDLSLAERATAAGTFTGFRQFHPPAAGARVPKPPPAKPNTAAARAHQPHPFPPRPNVPRPGRQIPVPVPGPGSPVKPIVSSLEFTPSRAAKAQRMATVTVDVAKLDAAFQRDTGFAIGPSGEGAIAGRREGFREFLAKGVTIEQSQIVVKADGSVSFVDGRHRFSVLRDMGVKEVPVSVPRSQADRARKFFGVTTPTDSEQPRAEAPKALEATPPAAPGPGESWMVTPEQAKDWVKDSVFPVTLYHRTYPPAKADIEANGINLSKTFGVYGQGLYTSTTPQKSFGPVTVEVALNIRNPLIADRMDIHRLQKEWGLPGEPLFGMAFRDEVVRRGYDAVITFFEDTYQGPSGENWVVVMKPETARFVQR